MVCYVILVYRVGFVFSLCLVNMFEEGIDEGLSFWGFLYFSLVKREITRVLSFLLLVKYSFGF